MLEGGCRCGAVRFSVPGRVMFQLLCQCTRCQDMTGAGHAPIMVCKNDGFAVEGELETYAYTAASGNTVTHHFCRQCGSPLFNRNSQFVNAVYVIAGALDDPGVFQPQRVIFTADAQPWDAVPDHLPSFQGMPTR
ncbi:MAG: GFA family protein [Pseudomonadota bacterium]